MPRFIYEVKSKIYLLQIYIIKISSYQQALQNLNPSKYYHKKKYLTAIEGLADAIKDLLQSNPWLTNSASKADEDWHKQMLKSLLQSTKVGRLHRYKYTKLINKGYLPLHLAISLKNYSLAKMLIEEYGASTGTNSISTNTTILDDLAESKIKIQDPELIQLLIKTHANRKPFGLIVGCGHGTSNVSSGFCACCHREPHAHIHRYEDFFTVDPHQELKADFQCLMQDLPQDFRNKYRGSLQYIVFEHVNDNILIPEKDTGHCKALDIAYDLLTQDGTCIISIGISRKYDQTLLAKLSGFTYGLYFSTPIEDSYVLYVKKNPEPILVSDKIKETIAYLDNYSADLDDVHALEVKPIDSLKFIESAALTFSYRNRSGEKLINSKVYLDLHLHVDPKLEPKRPNEHPTALIIKDYFSKKLTLT